MKKLSVVILADEKGYFSARLNMDGPGYIILWNTGLKLEDLYIPKGSNLVIEADASDRETFSATRTYSGTAALFNNYIEGVKSEHVKKYQLSIESYKLGTEAFIGSIVQPYKKIRDSLRSEWYRRLLPEQRKSKDITDFIITDSVTSAYWDLV